MPNLKNAKKALRQSSKRRLHNRTLRSSLRKVLKNFREAVAGDDVAAAQTALTAATKSLDQAASKGLIHKNKAARTKSRFSAMLNKKTAEA